MGTEKIDWGELIGAPLTILFLVAVMAYGDQVIAAIVAAFH